ncbi:hypothetical protein PTT_08558 [Pyrenophora teres f. teres 0-1]|uniref:Heterokaryon incompatibility domain-containing protein n=1 Tax=Pyrenophora teres f. teres (strain 0-1) TaxID=861557 RepID=E3RK26_PYRTT|nr:hypothetical protein PTT_08558 [Pyrenophora teres f. teres 0-1]
MGHDKLGLRTSPSPSETPTDLPTVSIRNYTYDSRVDSNGHLDYVVVNVLLQHHVSDVRDDSKSFMLHTEAGREFNRAICGNADVIDIKSRSATICAWLKECQTQHPACQKSMGANTPLGARILSVKEYAPGRFLVKLIETAEIDLRSEPYLVLSHVWGNTSMTCKTLKSNISCYQKFGIDFDILPKNFQDAVRITAAIGFEYIWIDSLCIIQDSTEDWQLESTKMAAIYHMATITLSATSANNGDGGCGLDTDFGQTVRFCKTPSGIPGFAAREITETIPSPATMLKSQLRNAPVNQRGWILQEQQLSRRILHAMDSQFVWECGMITESEDGTVYEQKKNTSMVKSLDRLENGIYHRRSPCNDADYHLDIYKSGYSWWKCVVDYSSRLLSKPEDQYAALAGIVQFRHETTGDLPVVGLWERYLAIHLAWGIYHNPCEHTVPVWNAAYRRPSWTWMSFQHSSAKLLHPISWPVLQVVGSREGDLGMIYQAHVLHTNVRWSGRPLISDPKSSTIRIRGVMHRRPRPKPVRHGILSPLHLDPGVPEQTDANAEYSAFALFTYVQSAALTNQPPFATTVYLIIQATNSEDDDEYMRIGRMQLTEPFEMNCRHGYLPEGVQRVITLV